MGATLIAPAAFAGASPETPPPMLGFTAAQATNEQNWERKFDTHLDAADQRAWLERMSAEPNHVGAPHDRANAEFMLAQFREWGWDAHLETFDVLFPTPTRRVLEMVAPTGFTASLEEPPVSGDRTSDRTRHALPPYNAYGADGDVTAELVYVNQGMPDDYKELDRHGISVKGRIVIARYGGGWRGLKPKLAQEHGAIGCLIYSDPRDDGYSAGDVYPKGGFRPPEGVQRGSVADMPVYPGDPLTPDVGATKDAPRLAREAAKTLLKIPVLPLAYANAQPLLAALDGPVAPAAWRGGLPITYHLGPGPAKVHLAVACDWSLKPIYDVIATLKGTEYPDQWVIRGNHHDGWVFGAWDPLSANVALMAEAKALGALVKEGWRPRRTLVYASWDGEEPGLLGSTEWVETHADELRHNAVLYVNSDSNGRGYLDAGGSHDFQTLVGQVAGGVRDPETGGTVLQRERAKIQVAGAAKSADDAARRRAREVAEGTGFPIGALGSGSDYTPFLQHVGIASLDLGYGGEDQDGGIYHSDYDSFDHFLRFGDPHFMYGVALAETTGHVIMRVADADLLPMRFSDFANTVGRYAGELHKLADTMREDTERQHQLLQANAFRLAADPAKTYVPPEREDDVPFINFAPLDNALARLKRSARLGDDACAHALRADAKPGAEQLGRVNGLLQGLEQTLLDPAGLPGREWYRHMIYAPGLQTGYGVKTLPGVREAIEQRRWAEVDRFVTIVARALDAYSDRLDQATAVLN